MLWLHACTDGARTFACAGSMHSRAVRQNFRRSCSYVCCMYSCMSLPTPARRGVSWAARRPDACIIHDVCGGLEVPALTVGPLLHFAPGAASSCVWLAQASLCRRQHQRVWGWSRASAPPLPVARLCCTALPPACAHSVVCRQTTCNRTAVNSAKARA